MDLTIGITEAVKIIRQRLEIARSRQKGYADKRRRPLEFQVGDTTTQSSNEIWEEGEARAKVCGAF